MCSVPERVGFFGRINRTDVLVSSHAAQDVRSRFQQSGVRVVGANLGRVVYYAEFGIMGAR